MRYAPFVFVAVPLFGADEGYKQALDSFEKKLAIRESREKAPDQVDDFSRQSATSTVDGAEPPVLEAARFRTLVKALSRVGRDVPALHASTVDLTMDASRRTFVSSEGTLSVEVRSSLDLSLVLRTGPVLLEGPAAPQLMPRGFTLDDDPSIDHVGELPLAGCYKADEEGVVGEKVRLVEDGIFKTFVMSRTPRKGFPRSNGHGRASGDEVRGQIANLLLSAKGGVSARDLRTRLLAEARAAKLPYAMIIRVFGDSTTRDEADWNRSERGLAPLVMWKITLDGKEERLRGGPLGDVPLSALKEILAAGNSVAVASDSSRSVVAPALLFKEIVIKKSREAAKKLPVVPRPDLGPQHATSSARESAQGSGWLSGNTGTGQPSRQSSVCSRGVLGGDMVA